MKGIPKTIERIKAFFSPKKRRARGRIRLRVYEVDVEVEQTVATERPYQLRVVLPRLEVRRKGTGRERWKVQLDDLQVCHAPWEGPPPEERRPTVEKSCPDPPDLAAEMPLVETPE